MDRPEVVPLSDILNGDVPNRKTTVVIGGGPTGCEVALHLSEHGSPVTLVEMLSKIGNRLETMTRKLFMERMRDHKVRFMTETSLLRVEDHSVVVKDKDGIETILEAERVVVTVGNRPDNRLSEQLEPLGFEIHRIGDCLEPRSAKAAIYEGAVLGREI
jgi:pyruvate/2-oxoglutarate dehydrogenase complex dihydrolipoamide dehydrogenase (E3) component